MNEARGNTDGHLKWDVEQQEKWVRSETSVPGSGHALSMAGQREAPVRRGAHSEETKPASIVAAGLPWNVETECRSVDHEMVLQHIREGHREQVLLSEFQLETCLPLSGARQARAEQEEAGESEEEKLSQNGSFINNQSQLLEKYLVSAALTTHSWAEEHSMLGKAEDCGYWGDSEEFLVGLESFSDDTAGPDGSAEVEKDLGKALLLQQCRDLASQLEKRDEQLEERSKRLEERDKELNKLQDEYCSSAAQLQEALDRREEVRQALEVLQNKLEAEQQQRLWCAEAVLREKREMEELKAELGRRERAGEQERGLMAELQQEKEQLFLQLRAQEQLVRDVQQQKLAGDSVSSEVQALFGRQLSILQEQRDRLQGMLDLQQAKNLTASELLGQKTIELDSSLEEVQKLQVKLAKMEVRLRSTGEDKRELESSLVGLQEKLAEAEQAVSRGLVEKAAREGRVLELEARAQTAENVLEAELGKFQSQVRDGALELQELREERDAARLELQEQVNDLKAEMERKQTELTACIALIKQVHERERQREMTALAAEREAELSRLGEELRESLETAHQTELLQTQTQHVLELEALRLNLANQHEAEQEALRLSLANRHEAEQETLRLSLTNRHEEEQEALQLNLANQHTAELEALRLNLANQHEAKLEALRLSLANQHIGEVEALQQSLTSQHSAEVEQRRLMEAVSEEQESLRARLAQTSTQHQAELQQIRDDQQNQNQWEIEHLNHAWETRLLKERIRMEEEQTVEIQALRAEWQKASDRTLEELRASLQETQETLTASRAQLQEVRSSGEQRLRCMEEELHLVRAERDHMTRASADLEAGHKRSLEEQRDRVSRLEELCRASTEREQDLQQQVVRLQSECVTLKSTSEREMHLLQSQLESMMVCQQELEEVREQLLVQSRGREEEEERMKRELECLRSCLEERHRGEVALLQLHPAEGGARGSSAPQVESDSYLFEGHGDGEKVDMLAEINLKLEEHKEELDSLRLCLEHRHTQELAHLRSRLALSHREDLLQVKAEMAETHLSQIQELRSTHALELQRQQAQLYDSHAKEVSRLRLQCARDAARQVEQEVEERSRVLAEELHTRTAQIQSLEAQLAALLQGREEQLMQAREEQEESLRDARKKLKLEFAQQLQGELLKQREVSQEKEAELGRVREELRGKEAELGRVTEELQAKEVEFNRLREEIQTEAEGRISTLREVLGQAAVEERNALEQEVRALQQELEEVQGRSEHCIKDSPDSERDPRIAAVRQKMEAQYQRELLTAKRLMAEEVKELNTVLQQQAEDRLQEAQRRFEKELQEQKAALRQQPNEHKEGLQSQGALLQARAPSLEEDCKNLEEELMHKHEAELDSLRAELLEKHKAELDCLKAELRELSHAHLEAHEAELRAEYKLEQDKMEARMLSNMDALEVALLVEVEGARAERDGALQALVEQERSQAARVDRLKSRHQAQLGLLCIELRRELDLVLIEAPSSAHTQPPGIELQLTPGTSGRGSQPEREVEEPDFVETGGHARELRDLFFKLKTDLRSVAAERKGLQEEHRQLQEVLKEVARRSLATEEEIQRRLCTHAKPVVSPGEEAREAPGAADLTFSETDDSQDQRPLSYSLDPGAQGVVLESFTRVCSAISGLLEWVQEREELQRQAEEDQSRLTSRLQLMEAESEEQESYRREEEEQRKAQTEDLSLQIRALEKQLRHHRQFIEEQTVEREQEREDFQLEIRNLEAELRRSSKPRLPGGEDQIEDMVLQVENLRAALRLKTEDYTELLQIKEKYKGGIAEQNEQIHKMAAHICKLEQDLLGKAELKRVQAAEMMCPSCLLMYAGQCNPDQRPRQSDWPPRGEAGPSLIEQQADLQMELLTASMEPAEAEPVRSGPSADLEEALLWKSTNQNWECARNVRKLPERPGETDMSLMLFDPLEQLKENRQEILRLREENLRLEREAEAFKNKAAEEAETTQREVEELRSQVEHLLSDRERLLKDREVQEERLHEVIHKLQEELEQMSPARHEVSPSLEGNPAPHPFLPLPLPLNHTPRGLQDSLCLELNFQTPHSEPQGVADPAPSRDRRWGAGGSIRGGEERDIFQLMTEVMLDEGQLQGHAHSPGLRGAGEGREEAHQGLGGMGGQKFGDEPLVGVGQETFLRVMKTLVAQNQETNAQILSLEMENAELRLGKGRLQQKVEVLGQEVESLRWELTSKRSHVPCLNSVSGMTLDLREVLIFADETLAKTAVTLKENEEHLALVKAELEALRAEHGAIKEEHEALKVRHDHIKAEHEALKAELDHKKVENEALKAELDQNVENEVLKKELYHKKVERVALKADPGHKRVENESLKVELDHKKVEHEALKVELDLKKVEHEALKAELDHKKVEHEALKAELDHKEVEHEALKVELDHKKVEHEGLKAELDHRKVEHEALKAELDHKKVEHKALKAGLDHKKAEHEALKAELNRKKVEHDDLKAGLDQMRAKFDALTAENDALKEVHEALWAGHASLKWKCVSAEERLKEMAAERQTHLEIAHLPSTSSPAQDTWHPPDSCRTTPTSTWQELSVPDSPPSEQVQRLDERYFTGQEESDSDGGTSEVSLDQEMITSAPGLSDSFLQYLHHRNMDVEDQSDSTADRMGQGAEVLSPELQVWLEKVHGEGQRVLYLSEHPATMATFRPLQAPPPGWQEERRALQQTVLSLRDLLCKMAAREPRQDRGDADGPRQLQQAVRSVLVTERAALCSELQAILQSSSALQLAPITEWLESLLQQQEERSWQHMQQLLSEERLYLLEELRELCSLLCSSSLRSEEQLRLLLVSLGTSSQEKHIEPCGQSSPAAGVILREQAGQIGRLRGEVEQERGEDRSVCSQLLSEQPCSEAPHTLEQRRRKLIELLEKEEQRPHNVIGHLEEEEQRGRKVIGQLEEEEQRGRKVIGQLEEEEQRRCEVIRQRKGEAQRRCGVIGQLEEDEQKRREVIRQLEDEEQRRREMIGQLKEEEQGRYEVIGQLDKEEKKRREVIGQLEEDEQRRQEVIRQLKEDEKGSREVIGQLEGEEQRRRAVIGQLEKNERRRQEVIGQLEEQEKGKCEVIGQPEEETFSHTHGLTGEEQRHKEVSTVEGRFKEELWAQLEQERRQSEELAASIKHLLQQNILIKRKLEEEVLRRRKATDLLQAVRKETSEERQRANQLQAQLDEDRLSHALSLEEEMQRRCTWVQREQEAALHLKEERSRADQLQALLDVLRGEVHSVKEARRKGGRQEQQGEREGEHCSIGHRLKLPRQESAAPQAVRCNTEPELQLTADGAKLPANSKLRRMYRKFLRAESYRKALVFQKRYLLLLLGGVQEGEQMTLALITSMGAFPSTPAPPTRSSPIARFRGAVLVAIAVSRLALLVRKWRRAFRIGPSEVVHPNGVRYTAGPCITAETPAYQTSIQTWVTQPNTTGRSFSPISQVPLQPIPLAQLQNIGPKK